MIKQFTVLLSLAFVAAFSQNEGKFSLPIMDQYGAQFFLPRNYKQARWGCTTSTFTTTSTFAVTCTQYTDQPCFGKRKRSFPDAADQSPESLILSPSPNLNRVEATATADLSSVREGRKADPQYNPFSVDGYDYNPFREVDLTYDSPFYYNPMGRHASAIDNNRGFAGNAFSILCWPTVTSRDFTVSTFRSTPSCSTTSGFGQC